MQMSVQVHFLSHPSIHPPQTGSTPAHLASWNGHKDCLALLVEARGDVNAVNRVRERQIGRGWSCVYVRLFDGWVCVSLWLQVEGCSRVRKSLKSHSRRLSTAESCYCMIYPDPVIHPQDGNTPLHVAAINARVACATILMEAGARRDIENNVSFHSYFTTE